MSARGAGIGERSAPEAPRAPTLAVLAEGHNNNFRLIRLAAATAVILSHAYFVNGGDAAIRNDFLERLTGVDSGELAVDVFFVTSGFLVSRSLIRRSDVIDYVLSRVLRITPGLAVSVLFAALVLGPLTTELPLHTYFGTRALYGYIVIDALSLSPLHERFGLPGVFPDLPMAGVVNAPLWTLPWEIWMYAALLALYAAGALGRVFPLILGLILACYAAVAVGYLHVGATPGHAIRFLAFFFCGCAFQLHADRARVSLALLAGSTAVFALISIATRSTLLLPVWLSYAVLWLAYSPAVVLSRFSHGADYSYGMYIYAYMVQQLLVWAFGPHGIAANTIATIALTLPLAMLSWHFVEKPALAFKNRLRQRRHLPAGEILG